ncbi:unnamed protein product [Schistosoma rodhaini]|uniref:Uncharacterized protein n=1 Tax=Schistosoma rodhaini TaxID=6188 RepID=A0AA85GAV5_9TREM|nr:unnamed protein product [Schistosoma rodhaini]
MISCTTALRANGKQKKRFEQQKQEYNIIVKGKHIRTRVKFVCPTTITPSIPFLTKYKHTNNC